MASYLPPYHKPKLPAHQTQGAMQETVVLYTWMVRGHLHPMTQLAGQFAGHGLRVTVAIADVPHAADSSGTVARLSSSYPSVSFHLLPPAPRASSAETDPNADPFVILIADLRATNPALLAFLRSLPSVRALVIDFFCSNGLDVAVELGIPRYFFFTSSAAALAVYLNLPLIHASTTASLKDMGSSLLHFPGVHPIPASDMPDALRDRDNDEYKTVLVLFERLPRAKGILVNTFEWLEAAAVKAIRDGLPLPGQLAPPVYCVGPLVGEERGGQEKHECLTWLDAQPDRSVVFLCFGSASSLSTEQLKEIAFGLERSGQRFLWAVRAPVPADGDPTKRFGRRAEPALEALLPEGFLERTRERGMVVTSWAPQVEALRHAATGAFVTHCGWNSTLEAIAAGVPMVCWPLYAEQRINKVLMVEEMKVGVVMQGYDEELVKADEVEAKIRLVMESEEGKALRERLAMAKEKAAGALHNGGSSAKAFEEFVKGLEIGGHD